LSYFEFYIAKHDFEKEPLFLKTKTGHQVCDFFPSRHDLCVYTSGQFQPTEYVAHHEVVFVDANSMVNLLGGIPLCSLDMVGFFVPISWLRQ